MRATIMRAPGNVVVTEVDHPKIIEPTDAIIELAAACICGSDLWPYRGYDKAENRAMGHEYVGTVVEVGSDVTEVKPGDFVVGSFCISDNTCEICNAGYQSRCVNGGFVSGTQAEFVRIPQADGTLVVVPGGRPTDPNVLASLLATSDVLGTGWFGAVAVVGDGAVGLLAILAARELGAERIIAMSRNPQRQAVATEFGATDIVEERGEEGVSHVKDLTNGLGAHSVIEAVGTQQSMTQAIGACRPGGHVGFVGVSHDVNLSGGLLFGTEVHLHGGPAPVRRFLPTLIGRVLDGKINPGRVFDQRIPLDEAPAGYKAMDERRAIKVLLEP